MKRLLLTLICFALAFLAFVSQLTRHSRNGPEVVLAESLTKQDPPPQQEWDPEKQGIGDLTEGPRTEVAPANRKPIAIVGQRFTLIEFASYLKKNVAPRLRKSGNWKPQFIVLHHTGIPSISQRPRGFTNDNMPSLARYYGINQGWRTGPHLFVDQNGIWVFTPLTQSGTHSPSWNRMAWGIEQLGDYTKESYDAGQGEKIRDNAVGAIAILSIAINLNVDTLHFHFEDPRTTHKSCPGSACKKADVISKVKAQIGNWRETWDSL
jgi:hypothetical protein